MTWAAVRSKAVILLLLLLLLLFVAPIVSGDSVCCSVLYALLVLQSPWWGREG